MAYNIQLSLNSVKDFMVEKGGRVTNHELVKHFKICLMNSEDKELARNKFKHYVNTLSNISQEGGEKFLVLKRKYRVGTILQVDEYPSPSPDSQPQFPYLQGSYGSPPSQTTLSDCSMGSSPGIPPPYRPPPPYRHPPSPASSPMFSPPHFNDPRSHNFSSPPPVYQYRSAPESPSTEMLPDISPYRRGSYQDPQDLGIPPPPPTIHRSSSSGYLIPNSSPSINISMSSSQSSADINSYSSGHRGYPDPVKAKLSFSNSSRKSDESLTKSLSSTTLSSSSLSSIPISVDSEAPIAPPRKRLENKEMRQSSIESNESSSDSTEKSESVSATSTPSAEDERKVSVREATQKFNRMASESQITTSGRSVGKSNRNSRADRDDDENFSITPFGLEGQEWISAASKSDFNEILRLLKIHPELVHYKFKANGYNALHWAAKHGRSEVIKLLHGTYQLNINSQTNGGYTPLHLAAIYNRSDTFGILSHYGGDLNIRDYSGKKPRQYQAAITTSTMSQEAQKRLVRRRNSLKEASAGFLRIGSLNVKVRKTTEAFNNLISRDVVEARLHRAWGSSDSLPETEKESKLHMPPPKFGPLKKRKHKKEKENLRSTVSPSSSSNISSLSSNSTPGAAPRSVYNVSSLSLPAIYNQDSDSDTACGFGSDWGGQP